MSAPTAADLADLELSAGTFYAACRDILRGYRPGMVQLMYRLTEGQLAYVRRFAGEPQELFAPAEQLALDVEDGVR